MILTALMLLLGVAGFAWWPYWLSLVFLSGFSIAARSVSLGRSIVIFWITLFLGVRYPNTMASSQFVGLGIATLVYVLVFFLRKRERKQLIWLRAGQMDQLSWGLGLLSGFSYPLVLLLWAYGFHYLGAGSSMMEGVQFYSKWIFLLLLIPFYSLFNAIIKEFLFRGILLQDLQSLFSNRIAVVFLSACIFGASQIYSGFPLGIVGFLLSLSFGMAMAVLRLRSQSIWPGAVVHFGVEAAMGYYLYFQALPIWR